jgi:hypothetical protein
MPRTDRLAAAVLAAASFWASGAGPAPAQPAAQAACERVDYRRLAAGLADRFAERPVALGSAEPVALVVFATADGATWTVVQLWPDGQACIAAAGHDWELLPPAGGPPGERS